MSFYGTVLRMYGLRIAPETCVVFDLFHPFGMGNGKRCCTTASPMDHHPAPAAPLFLLPARVDDSCGDQESRRPDPMFSRLNDARGRAVRERSRERVVVSVGRAICGVSCRAKRGKLFAGRPPPAGFESDSAGGGGQ